MNEWKRGTYYFMFMSCIYIEVLFFEFSQIATTVSFIRVLLIVIREFNSYVLSDFFILLNVM